MDSSTQEFLDAVDMAVRNALMGLPEPPTVEKVQQRYEYYFNVFLMDPDREPPLGLNKDKDLGFLIRRYCEDLNVTKEVGFSFTEDGYKPWLREAADGITWFYWNRYRNFLSAKWPRASVRGVEHDTREILDLLADPRSDQPFERLGLVVASVQSGKTSNYTGVICRAADAGYRIIIVLAGMYNDLRDQTQVRLEEGFTGFDIQDNVRPVGVGVGSPTKRIPVACTAREGDFSKQRAATIQGILKNVNPDVDSEPILLVVKKNSRTLASVYDWLRTCTSKELPLLLIDDEADNASINTNYRKHKTQEDPTTINRQIRKILNYYDKKAYVGYTATPFANILIDPDYEHDEYGSDIFPKSFIYTLEDSSDYFGAVKAFGDYDDEHPKHLRYIRDIDDVLPPKHKSGDVVKRLPESLKEAMRWFLLATAVHLCRGDSDQHSTMMINVSPYTDPQEQVAELADEYLEDLQNAVPSSACLPAAQGLEESSYLRDLKGTWDREHDDADGVTWDEVRRSLVEVLRDAKVVSINSARKKGKRLDYSNEPQRVIAVGGYRLSRGLTLEGLVVSYYSRNARAYDAITQMGRWFGYRGGYEDLCRVWMSEKSAGWFKFIADATDDLYTDFRRMASAHRTPKDYGLRIQASPETLMVTARDKLGSGELVTGRKLELRGVLSGACIETISFLRDPAVRQSNEAAASALLERISDYRVKRSPERRRRSRGEELYTGVPAQMVLDFLEQYQNDDEGSLATKWRPTRDYIEGRLDDGELTAWDVVVCAGEGEPWAEGRKRERRSPGSETTAERVRVGEKQHINSKSVEKAGLTEEQIDAAYQQYVKHHPDKDVKRNNLPGKAYRVVRERPLLILHPVTMAFSEEQIRSNGGPDAAPANVMAWPSYGHAENAFGWSISFPESKKAPAPVDYVLNSQAISEIAATFDEEGDEFYED